MTEKDFLKKRPMKINPNGDKGYKKISIPPNSDLFSEDLVYMVKDKKGNLLIMPEKNVTQFICPYCKHVKNKGACNNYKCPGRVQK